MNMDTKRLIRSDAIATASAALLAVGLLTGCTQGPRAGDAEIPPPTGAALSAEEKETVAAADQQLLIDDFHERFPNVELPVATRVQFIFPEQYADVIAPCWRDFGIDAAPNAGGGIDMQMTTDQEQAVALAQYICATRYPMDPALSVPLVASQIEYLYRYRTEVLKPCLEAAGYSVSNPPPMSDFVANFQDHAQWDPYSDVDGGPLWDSINKQCPQDAPHLFH